ncbi:hypothetical protein GQ44DRAFT_607814 [Phaeosphaeriaceae sp. PMI808]|nr:hypothetical protein GQ44DRAFT_607814 [Phaeosphaeriaceae sp. PMI808]
MTSPATDAPAASNSNAITPIAVSVGTLSTALLFVVARLYTRFCIIKRVGTDDWTILVAWILSCAVGIEVSVATRYGLGSHTSTLSMEALVRYLKFLFASIILYNAALMFVKVSFLMQYRRVFTRPPMSLLCNIGLVIVTVWGLFQILMTIFFCIPVHGFWDVTIKARCQPKLPFWYSNAIFNVLSDIAIFALPLPSLHSLHIRRVQKYVLIGVFSLGFFTCTISIVRISTLKGAAASTDPTYDNASTASWSVTELACGIICACAPTLRPLMAKLFPKLMSSVSGQECSHSYELQADPKPTTTSHTSRHFSKHASKESLRPGGTSERDACAISVEEEAPPSVGKAQQAKSFVV